MTAKLLAEHAGAEAWQAHWKDLAAVVESRGGCDLLLTDCPYSEKTHRGHDEGSAVSERAAKRRADWAQTGARAAGGAYAKRKGVATSAEERARVSHERRGSGPRRKLGYDFWTAADVDAFVAAWAPLTDGWFVTLTDHVLAPAWAAALERAGRYVFSPLACLEPGSRVRMSGDGPAQWSCWAVVARTKAQRDWGALPGGYVVPEGFSERGAALRERVVGAKPLWLCERLVEHYSLPGQLVVDPCAGGFTTGLACQRTGRRFVGGDALEAHARLGAERIKRPAQAPLFALGGGQ